MKKNMKKNLIYFIFLSLLSCKEKKETHYFNFYGEKDEIISKDTFKIVINKESFLKEIYIKENKYCSFKEQQRSDGIYRATNKDYQKTHYFEHQFEYFRNSLEIKEPFLNPEIRYNIFKKYVLGKDTFKIISFSEFHEGVTDTWTYYLSDFGFICYYDKDSDSYSFCDSTSNSFIKEPILQKLRSYLTSDTSFFARYGYRKMNYSRKGVIE